MACIDPFPIHHAFPHKFDNATMQDVDLIPRDFPHHVDSPLAWTGEELAAKLGEVILQLTADEVEEVERGLAVFCGKSRPL